jgi:hypothetical protein
VPQSQEAPVSAVPTQEATTFEATQHADTLADMGSLTAPTNMVYFGETIRSFRTLLKRYSMVELVSLPLPDVALPATKAHIIQRKNFPIEPGFTGKSDLLPTRVTKTVSGKEYAYGFMTPLRFISAGFVGWRGSIRWKVTSSNLCCSTTKAPVTVTRYSSCVPSNITETIANKQTNVGLQNWYTHFDESSNMQEGAQLIPLTVEPIASFETPFYNKHRFLPARSLTVFSSSAGNELSNSASCWKYGYETQQSVFSPNDSLQHQLYCAAGEDFTLGMFIGAPIVYLESIPPA